MPVIRILIRIPGKSGLTELGLMVVTDIPQVGEHIITVESKRNSHGNVKDYYRVIDVSYFINLDSDDIYPIRVIVKPIDPTGKIGQSFGRLLQALEDVGVALMLWIQRKLGVGNERKT